MSRQSTVARVEQIAAQAAEQANIEVVEVELKGSGRNQLLRILIDKPEGVTHADCELISHRVGELLDAEDVVPGHYTLEVSSPGVERKLRKPEDYSRFRGQKARLVLRESVANRKFIEGTLAGTEESDVLVDIAGGERLRVPMTSIDRANLKFEW